MFLFRIIIAIKSKPKVLQFMEWSLARKIVNSRKGKRLGLEAFEYILLDKHRLF